MIHRSFVAASLVAAGLLAMPGAASAQGLLDIGRALLGLPSGEEQKDPIDYRERAPLVVPPNQNLRPPVEGRSAEERRGNWPQDPDVLARRRAAEEARRPGSTDSVTAREGQLGRRMTPDEIRAGRVAGAEVTRVPTSPVDHSRASESHNLFGGLRALREMDRRDADAATRATELREEPKREFLTDPPTGLRRPADNAPMRATREGQVGARRDPSPFDIYREGPNTR